jgi:hypothetical protein
MFQKRYLRGLLLIGAVAGIVMTSLQIAGASATSSSNTSPLPTIPSQSPSEIQAVAKEMPPNNEVPQSGPELSLSQVQQIALKYAKFANEPNPDDMKVAQGLFVNEWNLVQKTVGNTSSGVSNELGAANSAFFVVMHGSFTLSDVPVPPGRKSPTGTVMGLILDAHTGFPEGRYLGTTTPNIESLGSVVQLGGSH